jgi:hypothetical protein
MRRRVTLWFSRLTNAFRSSRLDRELEDEIRFHLEARTEELVRQGMTLREAGRAASLVIRRPSASAAAT